LAGKPEEKRPIGGKTRREIEWGSTDWFYLVQDGE
jgi:hypothetical protein